jgi:hypothetical protein
MAASSPRGYAGAGAMRKTRAREQGKKTLHQTPELVEGKALGRGGVAQPDHGLISVTHQVNSSFTFLFQSFL